MPLTELAEAASRLLYGSTTPEKYVTAAFAELELATGAITFVGAGHVDNVILRANGEAIRMSSTGMPLGLLPPGFPFTHSSHHLEPGDVLVLFSDGVTDAVDESDQEFGEERLLGRTAPVRRAPADGHCRRCGRGNRPLRRQRAAVRRHHDADGPPHRLNVPFRQLVAAA